MIRAGAGIALLLGTRSDAVDERVTLGAFDGHRVSHPPHSAASEAQEFELEVHHLRTGRTMRMTASIEGSGPTAVVTIIANGGTSHEFSMRDLPEDAARAYLRLHASQHSALD
jgi:hypothetical protein